MDLGKIHLITLTTRMQDTTHECQLRLHVDQSRVRYALTAGPDRSTIKVSRPDVHAYYYHHRTVIFRPPRIHEMRTVA